MKEIESMKTMKMFVLALLVSAVATGCATSEESEPTEPTQESCEGATSELGALSCEKRLPVTEAGLTPGQLANPLAVSLITADEAAKAARTYTGSCTGIWYGCSRVQAEGWIYESCGSSHYVFMTFDGPWGNLTGYGIG
jgi:hypothetical protein